MMISGFVYDQNKTPLPAATVEVLDKNGNSLPLRKGTTTNEKGFFSVDVEPGQILEASYLGHSKERLPITNDGEKAFYLNKSAAEGPDVPIVSKKTNWVLLGVALLGLYYFMKK